jgi:hypothetical protein
MPDAPIAPSSPTPDGGSSFEPTIDPATKPARPPILHRLVVTLPERNGAGFTVNVTEEERRFGLDKQETVRLVRMRDDGLTPDIRIIPRSQYEELYKSAKIKADKQNQPLVPKTPAVLNQSHLYWKDGSAEVRYYDGRSNKYLLSVETKNGTRITKLVDAALVNNVANPPPRYEDADRAIEAFNETLLIGTKEEKKEEPAKKDPPKKEAPKKAPPITKKETEPAPEPSTDPTQVDASASAPVAEEKPASEEAAGPVASTPPPSGPTIGWTPSSLSAQSIPETRAALRAEQQAGSPVVQIQQEYQQLVQTNAQRILTARPERLATPSIDAAGSALDLLTPIERDGVAQSAFSQLQASHPDIPPSLLQKTIGGFSASPRSGTQPAFSGSNDQPQRNTIVFSPKTLAGTPRTSERPTIDASASPIAIQAGISIQNLEEQKQELEKQLARFAAEQVQANQELMQLLQQQALQTRNASAEQRALLTAKIDTVRAKNIARAAQNTLTRDLFHKTFSALSDLQLASRNALESELKNETLNATLTATMVAAEKLLSLPSSQLTPSPIPTPSSNPTRATSPQPPSKEEKKVSSLERIRRSALRPLLFAASMNASSAAPASSSPDAYTTAMQAPPVSSDAGIVNGSPFFEAGSSNQETTEVDESSQSVHRQAELMRQKTLAMRQTQAQFVGGTSTDGLEASSADQQGNTGDLVAQQEENATEESSEEPTEAEMAAELEKQKQEERNNQLKDELKSRVKTEIRKKVQERIRTSLTQRAGQAAVRSAAAGAEATAAAGAAGGAASGAAAAEGAAAAGGPVVWALAIIVGFFWLNIRLLFPSEKSTWRKPLTPIGKIGVVCLDILGVLQAICMLALFITFIFIVMGGPFLVGGWYLGHTIGQLIGRALGFVSSLAP